MQEKFEERDDVTRRRKSNKEPIQWNHQQNTIEKTEVSATPTQLLSGMKSVAPEG